MTGTLSVSDIANSSETRSSGIGLSYDGEKSNSGTSMLGDKGLIPNIPMATNESDSSITKSGIAEGSITITKPGKQKQDLSQINRNTEGAANALKNSFDPQELQERQETAALFGELAANAIHDIAKKNGWKDGSPEKIAMHAAVAAVMAGISKGDITAAAITGGSTEALSNTILKAVGKDNGSSAEAQWAAAVVGAALSSATGGDAQSGASIAANAVKNNHLTQKEFEEMVEKTAETRNTSDLAEKAALSEQRDREWHREHENDKAIGRDEHGNEIYKAYYVGLDVNGNDQYLFAGPGNKGFTVDKNVVVPEYLKTVINNYPYKKLKEGEIYSTSMTVNTFKGSISIGMSITSTGEKYANINIIGSLVNVGANIPFGGNYSEGIYNVLDKQGRLVKNADIIRETLTGVGLVGNTTANVISYDISYSPSSGCKVVNSNHAQALGSGFAGTGLSGGISIGTYLGR